MRTTLQLDDALITEAKVLAIRTGRTLSQVVEDSLRQTFRLRPATAHRLVALPTSPGAPIEAGVLDHGVALRDAMDGLG